MGMTPDIAINYSKPVPGPKTNIRTFSPESNYNRHQRPVSEILKPETFASVETEALDKWYEDLQQYESSLESMASANLDPKYQEEVQHVDQWFRFLNEAERTATVYTLLQQSSQVQIRFFIAVLQQLSNKDPLGALLSPAHPERVDMQTQLAGAMIKAELEASQKLLSAIPRQTGQVISRPNNNIGRRNQIDRHSFALGDTEEYDHLFAGMSGASNDFLTPRNSQSFGIPDDSLRQQHPRLQQQQRRLFNNTPASRPKSVIEGANISSIFNKEWSYGSTAGGFAGHHQPQQQNGMGVVPNNMGNVTLTGRPKSADVSSWSFGLNPSVSSKTIREKDSLSSPWQGVSATSSDQLQQERPLSVNIDQDLSMLAGNWHLSNNGGTSDGRPVTIKDRRRTMNQTNIPGTVLETDESLLKNSRQSPPPPYASKLDHHTNIVLSVYDDTQQSIANSSFLPDNSNSAANSNYSLAYSQQQHIPRTSSFSTAPSVPTQQTPNNLFNNRHSPRTVKQQIPSMNVQASYGQFLNPNDRVLDPENGYLSDHSDASARSGQSSSRQMKNIGGNNGLLNIYSNGNRNFNNTAVNGTNGQQNVSAGGISNSSIGGKDINKKNSEAIDMELLEDVPAWLRNLRLHKYNPIFETMKWQEMVRMNEDALLGKGVAALGARRKLLKVFDQVKAHCESNNRPVNITLAAETLND